MTITNTMMSESASETESRIKALIARGNAPVKLEYYKPHNVVNSDNSLNQTENSIANNNNSSEAAAAASGCPQKRSLDNENDASMNNDINIDDDDEAGPESLTKNIDGADPQSQGPESKRQKKERGQWRNKQRNRQAKEQREKKEEELLLQNNDAVAAVLAFETRICPELAFWGVCSKRMPKEMEDRMLLLKQKQEQEQQILKQESEAQEAPVPESKRAAKRRRAMEQKGKGKGGKNNDDDNSQNGPGQKGKGKHWTKPVIGEDGEKYCGQCHDVDKRIEQILRQKEEIENGPSTGNSNGGMNSNTVNTESDTNPVTIECLEVPNTVTDSSTSSTEIAMSVFKRDLNLSNLDNNETKDNHTSNNPLSDARCRAIKDVGYPTTCEVFKKHGFCPAGLNCYWAYSHTDFEKKENIRKFEIESSGKDSENNKAELNRIMMLMGGREELLRVPIQSGFDELNIVRDEMKHMLRKRTYDLSKSDKVLNDVDRYKYEKRNNVQSPQAIVKEDIKEDVEMIVSESSSSAAVNENQDSVTVTDTVTGNTNSDPTVKVITNTDAKSPSNSDHEDDSTKSNTATVTTSSSPNLRALGAHLETPDKSHDSPFIKKRRLFELRKARSVLAPLTTVGNLPFRRLCVELGAEVTMSEMALAESIMSGSQSEIALLRRHKSEKFFGIQVTSGSHAVMTRCAQWIDQELNHNDNNSGLSGCDWVDINAACPLEQLHNKGCGSILTAREGCLENMVRGMSNVMDTTPLSVKIRMMHYDNDLKNNAYNLIPKLQSWGANAVILHGRTARQRYTKLADWNYLKLCRDRMLTHDDMKESDQVMNDTSGLNWSRIPLIGCGDVMNYNQYYQYIREERVDSVMIGRGALIKPWIFSEIRDKRTIDLSGSERLELVKKYCHYGLEHWGSDRKGVEQTRRFLLEWLSFFHRYVPSGLLEREYQDHSQINWRPPQSLMGRNDLETILGSKDSHDWVRISEMFLGKVPANFSFVPKHKSNSYN